jgi:hypothetical protein
MAADAVLPSHVAVTVALPEATPLTSPEPFTVAIVPALVDQVIFRPVSVAPFASETVACSCTVAPAATLASAGATTIDATGWLVTLMNAVSARVLTVAINTDSPLSLAA